MSQQNNQVDYNLFFLFNLKTYFIFNLSIQINGANFTFNRGTVGAQINQEKKLMMAYLTTSWSSYHLSIRCFLNRKLVFLSFKKSSKTWSYCLTILRAENSFYVPRLQIGHADQSTEPRLYLEPWFSFYCCVFLSNTVLFTCYSSQSLRILALIFVGIYFFCELTLFTMFVFVPIFSKFNSLRFLHQNWNEIYTRQVC